MSNINVSTTKNFSYGLFVLTSCDNNKHNGCIINTAIQLTSEPYKISIAINKQNFTTSQILNSGKFNISILSENAKFDVFQRFGFQSGKDVDKFKDFETKTSSNGLKYLNSNVANAYISAKVVNHVDVGTHILFIAEVVEAEVLSNAPSLTYSYYFANVKPKPQTKKSSESEVHTCLLCGYVYDDAKENTPFKDLPKDFSCPICGSTEFEKTKGEIKSKPTNLKKVWVCSICGYVYDDNVEKIPFEELPSDWTCPLCKHPKSDFELQS